MNDEPTIQLPKSKSQISLLCGYATFFTGGFIYILNIVLMDDVNAYAPLISWLFWAFTAGFLLLSWSYKQSEGVIKEEKK